jgi:molecular chaperone GrpE
LKTAQSPSTAELKQTNRIFSMSDHKKPESNQDLSKNAQPLNQALNPDQVNMGADGVPLDASPEEREAALAANEVETMSELAIAQAEVATLKAKVADLQDQYMRGQAEVQNARRRADEDVSKARKFAVEAFAESLLPVTDSLEAGLAIKDATPEQVREGATATLRQLTSALERNKVIAINPEAGAKFDPHQHQAISVVPSDLEANSVVMVLQKGYLIADRVLRPALVTVSAPK